MLRVDPGDYARKRQEMRERSSKLRTEMIEAELKDATFEPKIHTRRRGSFDKPQGQVSLEDQVRSQMMTDDIFEAPLPATLKRLNMGKGTDSAGVDSTERGNSGSKASKKGVGQSQFMQEEDVENMNNSVVYKPRESDESSMHLRGNRRSNKGTSQADADAAFQLSLRTEEQGYNIDAVVPMGTRPTASNRAKGGKIPLSSTRRRGSADSVPAMGSNASPITYNSPQKEMRPTPETPPPLEQGGRSNALSNLSTYLSPPPQPTRGDATTTGGSGAGISSDKRNSGAGTGEKSRPSSAGTPRSGKKATPLKFSSPQAHSNGKQRLIGSNEKRQARSRLSLLKSKMPPRKSESARQSRPREAGAFGTTGPVPGAALSPSVGSRERRRASLSAAVKKFNSETTFGGDGEEKLEGEGEGEGEGEEDVASSNLDVSASEPYLAVGTEGGFKDSSDGAQVQSLRHQRPHGPVVHKAAKVGRPTLRARRSADMEGFNPITGEPLSPTPVAPPSRSGAVAGTAPQNKVNDNGDKGSAGMRAEEKGSSGHYGHLQPQQPYSVQQSIEIHHKADAEVTVPQIFLDLPQDAFESVENAVGELVQCPHCERKFGEKALTRHVKVCKSVFLEKPKVFNSSRMRISAVAKLNKPDNTEMMILESAVNATDGAPSMSINSPTAARMARKKKRERQARESGKRAAPAGRGGKWKSQSQALRRAMMEARGKSTKDMGDVDEGVIDTLVPCPHCSRKFNQTAASRHIPQCQNIKAKPKTLKKNTGMSAVAKAKKETSSRKVATRIL